MDKLRLGSVILSRLSDCLRSYGSEIGIQYVVLNLGKVRLLLDDNNIAVFLHYFEHGHKIKGLKNDNISNKKIATYFSLIRHYAIN